MWNSKDVYYISDSTGILVTNLGQALTCQFPEINFVEESYPFVPIITEAREIVKTILKRSAGRRPLVFISVMDPEIRQIFDNPEVEFFDIFGSLLDDLEHSLESKALRVPGFSHHMDGMEMGKRVEAIHYCLDHDDGTKTYEYGEADIILLGVSRAGKTPVSVYLATQMGYKAANFPLTTEYLNQYKLPPSLKAVAKRLVGLTTSPEFLSSVREKRYPGSKYAKISTCREEIEQAEEIYRRNGIPSVSSSGKSIEEIAMQICQVVFLPKKKVTLRP
ncbi:MAG: pyruvate, phosphate dikinase/phosphoenolpyruvate synthase regulator [Deltaproteobacteria bacterium]|nr:pyruvate, phosphate dikinase/phosphoenolpyruvate synthase regulator [Deltaproteobacteria bacterium]